MQQNTSLQNAIGDQAIKLRLVDAPTIENCLQLLDRAVDNAVENDKEVSPAVQSFMHRTLLKLQKQHEKKMEEAEEQQQQQPQQQQQRRRHRQQQQVIPIKYHCGGCPRGRHLTSPSMKGETVKQKNDRKWPLNQSCSS